MTLGMVKLSTVKMRLRPTGFPRSGIQRPTRLPVSRARSGRTMKTSLEAHSTRRPRAGCLETGELVYGVSTRSISTSVPNLRRHYVAGIDADKTFSLTPENADPSYSISSTKDTCKTISIRRR